MKKNRNKKKFITASMCVVFAALLILAGCGQKEARIDKETDTSGVTQPAIETTQEENTKETTTQKETQTKEVTTKETVTKETNIAENITTPAIETTTQQETKETTTAAPQQQIQTTERQTVKPNNTAAPVLSGDEPVTTYNSEKQTSHKHDYVARTTKEATCTSEGIITYTCEYDGDTYLEYTPKIAHSIVPVTVVEATCGVPGQISYDCEICGTHDHTETISATGNHNYTPVYKTESVTKYICDCGQSFDSKANWNSHSNASGGGHSHCTTKQYSVNTAEIDHYECMTCGAVK